MHGAEIWGAYETVDFDTWDMLPIKQTQLQFCKCILGVNRSATNLICQAEIRRVLLKIDTDLRILSFLSIASCY